MGIFMYDHGHQRMGIHLSAFLPDRGYSPDGRGLFSFLGLALRGRFAGRIPPRLSGTPRGSGQLHGWSSVGVSCMAMAPLIPAFREHWLLSAATDSTGTCCPTEAKLFRPTLIQTTFLRAVGAKLQFRASRGVTNPGPRFDRSEVTLHAWGMVGIVAMSAVRCSDGVGQTPSEPKPRVLTARQPGDRPTLTPRPRWRSTQTRLISVGGGAAQSEHRIGFFDRMREF